MANDSDMQLVCKPEYPTYLTSQGRASCLVSLLAPSVDEAKRAPISVTLVLDKSGSMAGSKLELVKATCKFLLQQLGSQDSVSVVSYDSQVAKDHSLVRASAENKDTVAAAIDRIKAGSATNLSGGLFMGLTEQLRAAKTPTPPSAEAWAQSATPSATIHSVFLFTDGVANCGLMLLNDIKNAMSNMLSAHSEQAQVDANGYRQPPAPVKVHTFGFGSDHNSEVLQGIASCANGTYYYIESPENIPETFADALGGLLSVYAQNVELTVTALGDNTIQDVHTGFTKRTDGLSTVVSLPDVLSEERKDAVVDMLLSAITGEESTDVVKVELSYVNVVRGELVTREQVLSLGRAALLPVDMTADEEVVMHRTRLAVASRLRQAVQLADNGRYSEADSVLAEQETELNNLVVQVASDDEDNESNIAFGAPRSSTMYAALRQDVQRTRRTVQRPQQWGASGRHFATSRMASHADQRSIGIGFGPQRTRSRPSAPTALPTSALAFGEPLMSVPRSSFLVLDATNTSENAAPDGSVAQTRTNKKLIKLLLSVKNALFGAPAVEPPMPPSPHAVDWSTMPATRALPTLATRALPTTYLGAFPHAALSPPAAYGAAAAAATSMEESASDEEEETNLYANSCQRSLVQKAKDAVQKN